MSQCGNCVHFKNRWRNGEVLKGLCKLKPPEWHKGRWAQPTVTSTNTCGSWRFFRQLCNICGDQQDRNTEYYFLDSGNSFALLYGFYAHESCFAVWDDQDRLYKSREHEALPWWKKIFHHPHCFIKYVERG